MKYIYISKPEPDWSNLIGIINTLIDIINTLIDTINPLTLVLEEAQDAWI